MVSGAVTWKSRSDRNAGTPGCAQEATNSPGQMPPFEPLRGIAYGALPCREHQCLDAGGMVSEDMLQASYMGQWGASGRDDLGTIAKLGGNAVRLYHSLGSGVDADHSGFLDRSAEVGVNVLPGYHTHMACPDFDCFESWKQATLHGFQHGFQKGDDWHPAVAALILMNEPDLVHPGSGAVGRIKLVLSALDGVLAAEKEAGVVAGRTQLTVSWSFAKHDTLDGSTSTWVTHWGFRDTKTGMSNPAVAGYNPRCSRAELMHAFETRWVHNVNTQAPWDFVDAVLSGEEPTFAPTPWFIGEYGANGQPAATIQRDLENMAQKAKEDDMFLGAVFFQFQTAHFKGGSETNFGLFRLGEQKLSESSGLPVYCLSTDLWWLRLGMASTLADRASAVAAAWHGSLEGMKGLCAGGRRLDIGTEPAILV